MKKLFAMLMAALMLTLPAAMATEIGGGLDMTGTGTVIPDTTEEPVEVGAPFISVGGGLNVNFGQTEPGGNAPTDPEPAVSGDWYLDCALEHAVLLGAAVNDADFMDTYGPGSFSATVTALYGIDFSAPVSVQTLKGGSMDIARNEAWNYNSFGYEAATVFSQWNSLYSVDLPSYAMESDPADVSLWATYLSAHAAPPAFEPQVLLLEYPGCCVAVQFIDAGEGVISKSILYPTDDNFSIYNIIDEIMNQELFTGPFAY